MINLFEIIKSNPHFAGLILLALAIGLIGCCFLESRAKRFKKEEEEKMKKYRKGIG